MNNTAQILPLKVNILSQFKEISEEVKSLEAKKSALRGQILAMMDQNQTDTLSLGNCKATRSLVIQERMDTKKVKEFLGDQYQGFVTEVSQIRLSVI